MVIEERKNYLCYAIRVDIIINQIRALMSTENKNHHNYELSDKRKADLIEMVVTEGKSITYASKKLRIKYTRARNVIVNYNDSKNPSTEGTVKMQENSNQEPQAQIPENQNPSNMENIQLLDNPPAELNQYQPLNYCQMFYSPNMICCSPSYYFWVPQ